MRVHHAVALLLLAWVTGCASGRVARLETGQGPPLVFAPRNDEAQPVELERREFKEALAWLARENWPPANPQGAAQQLFGVDARSGAYLFNPGTRRVTPLEGAALEHDAPQAVSLPGFHGQVGYATCGTCEAASSKAAGLT